MSATVTVDIGTTGIKLCLFAGDGTVLAADTHPTPTTRDLWGEVYDLPVLTGVITAFLQGLDVGLRTQISHITFAGTGESGGLVREDMSIASPMILWHDHRGADYLTALSLENRDTIYRVTGLPVNANYGISKAAWALAHAEDADGAVWMNLAEYLAAALTGQRWAEWSLASRTMALNVRSRSWSAEVCALFGLTIDRFPEIRPASYGAPILQEVADRLGIQPDVLVHTAGHDHMVGAAAAELAPGEVLNSTGTTEGILVVQDQPSLDPSFQASKLANGVSCTGDSNTLFASIPTGGSAFATLRGLTGLTETALVAMIDELLDDYLSERVDLDSIPLVLPQFRGAPPPTKDASARGLVAGIHSHTSSRDLVFGTFLGLVLQFADVLELFNVELRSVKVIGPASRNLLWLHLKADVLNVPLTASRFPEVVSRGAFLLADDSTGAWADMNPTVIQPNRARHDILTSWVRRHRPVWDHLLSTPTVDHASTSPRRAT